MSRKSSNLIETLHKLEELENSNQGGRHDDHIDTLMEKALEEARKRRGESPALPPPLRYTEF